MERDFLENHPDLLVKQTRKGWLMELCCGCDANTEFKIATLNDPDHDILYATENSSCCIRVICGPLRPFTITVSEGGVSGGKIHSLHKRPRACPPACCKCCCYQQIETKHPNGSSIGKVIENVWCCVPSFTVLDMNQNQQYFIQQPTCCGGCCVNCCAEGFCTCRVPFYIYEPGQHVMGQEVGKVVKIWSGLLNEVYTDADKFELRFPANADSHNKARLLSALFLINQLFFENNYSGSGGGSQGGGGGNS
eukprot:gene8736-10337_t